MASALTLTNDVPNRRGSARSPLFTLVRVVGTDETLWASDVSLGGMMCQGRRPRWPGTYLDVEFALPGTTQKLLVGAQVVTLDTGEGGQVTLGLRFCRVTRSVQLALYRFLDRRRALWSDDEETPGARVWAERYPSLSHVFNQEKPFLSLVREAKDAINKKQRETGTFYKALSRLKRVVRPD